MRKTILSIFVLTVLFGFTQASFAFDPVEKLGTGVKEFVTSPLEIGTNTARYSDAFEFTPMGVVAGLVEGTGQFMMKSFSGLFKIVTFPFESPDC